jgi:hypothetical protein
MYRVVKDPFKKKNQGQDHREKHEGSRSIDDFKELH